MTNPQGAAALPAPSRIVVGVDGSALSRRALEWAVAEARLRAAAVHVITAWEYPAVVVGMEGALDTREIEAGARHGLDATLLRVPHQDVEVTSEVVRGGAARILIEASARAGRPTVVPGPFHTMMGPLRCGEVSPLAFEAAFPFVAGYIAIDDEWAVQAMRRLARPLPDDPPLVAGPSGAAALGGLLAARRDPAALAFSTALDLGAAATVLLIVSEGLTDPPLWREVVGGA